MHKDKILAVIARYRHELQELGAEKARYPEEILAPPTGTNQQIHLAHLLQMLDQMEVFLEEGRREKTHRWLGFIQGVLWVLRINTLEELKNHNRPSE